MSDRTLVILQVAAAVIAIALCAAAIVVAPAAKADDRIPTADVALILAIDVSGSVDAAERQIQREGYAAALASAEVLQAIQDGAHGRILITVVEWSDESDQETRVPWTVVDDAADLIAVGEGVKAKGSAIPHSSTSIAGMMNKAAALFEIAPARAERLVLDISGDGKDYQTAKMGVARATLIARGIVINGLPILARPDHPDLVNYYRTEVIGGPGSFVMPARSFREIAPALIQKLVLELA